MKRRNFIKNLSLAASAPIMFNGVPVKMMANAMTDILRSMNGDRVLVMIQLAGGNDGLNTLIPINQYDKYHEFRSNIAIPDSGTRRFIDLDPTLPTDQLIGLHPDMISVKELYDDARALFIQNVGYDNMDLSHFRGRDIMFMGGGTEDYYNSGFMGRYLDDIYPGYPDSFPNETMPDPLGLEFGYTQSLLFHRSEGIPAGIAITDPDTFYQLVTGVGGDPPSYIPDSYAGDELSYLMDIETKSNQYADRLKEVYDKGINSPNVSYPENYPLPAPQQIKNNELSWQLKNIARLLSGGIKTRIFLVKIDGFDTHAEQVEAEDTTTGVHGALLYHLSGAVKAFMDDLKELGIEERVITVTTSEFGRRVHSNASLGTDHGKAAPVFLFGSGLKPGVIGSNSDLLNLDDGNLVHNYDYRQIYTSLLMDWMGADFETIVKTKFDPFIDTRLDIIGSHFGLSENKINNFQILTIGPNPTNSYTTVRYERNNTLPINLTISTLSGKVIRRTQLSDGNPGIQEERLNFEGVTPGYYILNFISGGQKVSKKLLVH